MSCINENDADLQVHVVNQWLHPKLYFMDFLNNQNLTRVDPQGECS